MYNYMQLPPSSTTFEFEVMLNHYVNAEERVGSRGDYCDVICVPPYCSCDNIFTFCLRPLGTTRDNNNNTNCPLGRFVTGTFYDNDNINFTRDLMNSVSNPLVYSGNLWPVSPEIIVLP